jgi:GntR family transcriptional regulator
VVPLHLDFDLAEPIYLQIINEIKRAIVRGEIAPGDKIPSQREMAQKLKVNPNTVQRAYIEMERIHLVETLRGQGTFICCNLDLVNSIREQMAYEAVKAFIGEVLSLGLNHKEIQKLIEEELKPLGKNGNENE